MGLKNNLRPVNGILLLDKPAGMTSNRALQRVKRLYGAAKAGHTGSLDPLATGLLPICFGEATKVSGFLLDADKRYRVRCRLGQTMTTGDAEGELLQQSPVPVLDTPHIEAALAPLRGPIQQVPPMYSALKHQGRRLYALAREGKEVERPPRPVTIHLLELLEQAEEELELLVHCSKGTYVRSLVEDLGANLGCGAHVTMLRRIGLDPFDHPEMVALEGLEERSQEELDALLLPVEAGLAEWPEVRLDADAAHYLLQGQAVWVPGAPEPGLVRLHGPDVFLGMGEVRDDGKVAPKRLMNL
ncbi:MAG: tRNA pseudouridine(55) synthase TruB [Ectothiorhodospiraceae bacterium]|nr:tRNA pseudouridine(55) synthase TruB [Ectothiorhodospiraceae bacterium]